MFGENYALSEEGFNRVVNIIAEFLHGYSFEEIVENNDLDADAIKVLLFVMMESYRKKVFTDG